MLGDCDHPFVREITEALVEEFDRPTLGNKRNPFNELLFILLSSRTPPQSYQDAYRSLRRKFETADSLANASLDEITAAIEIGGLQNKKARAISMIALELRRRFRRVTLAPLKYMTTSEAENFLTSLHGVSVKTARCVLMYAFDRLVFPMDVHCYRVSRRLGWIPSEMSRTQIQADEFQACIPENLRKDLHVGMVQLGRKYCRPVKPKCTECPITNYCPEGCCDGRK